MSEDAVKQDPVPSSRRSVRRKVLIAGGVVLALAAGVLVAAKIYIGSVGRPDMLTFPESTTLYYADGRTVLARLGETLRYELRSDDIADQVKQAAVAARDPDFWTSGSSTITRDVARTYYDLADGGVSAKATLAVLTSRLEDELSKDQILALYLNGPGYGRNTYGIEAAANVYFGKTARKSAPAPKQVTTAEAIALAAMLARPNPGPGEVGFDPTVSDAAKANAERRFGEIRDELVTLGYITDADAAKLTLPIPMKQSPLPGPPGPSALVVHQVAAELRLANGRFKGWSDRAIADGGLSIVTTLDPKLQRSAETIANPTDRSSVLYGEPANLQAAAVVVQPGTGRVLAYYGGDNGAGADYAGVYRDDQGDLAGFGAHPTGTAFFPITLAAALRAGVSVKSVWSTTPSDRLADGTWVRDTGRCGRATQGTPCSLVDAMTYGLRTVYNRVTTKIGPGAVLTTAQATGIDNMWTTLDHKRFALTEAGAATLTPTPFGAAVGLGAYPVTVVDLANTMATFGAQGVRASVHFVARVSKNDEVLYQETLPPASAPRVLKAEQVADLGWAMSQSLASHVGSGITAAIKTGNFPMKEKPDQNAHTWAVGYTGQLAVAVWVGNRRTEAALLDKDGRPIWGAAQPTTIFQRLLVSAYQDLALTFEPLPGPTYVGDPDAGNASS